jgi:hypothetical protein
MYLYHSQAAAIGGEIRRPIAQVINVPCASSLSTCGGYQSSKMGRYEIDNILSFDAASTQVSGSFDAGENAWNSLTTCVVENFRMLNVVSARRIVAQFAVRQFADKPEPEIVPTGTQFDGLRINGALIDVELDLDLFSKCATYSSLKQCYEKDSAKKAQLDKICYWGKNAANAPEFLKERVGWIKDPKVLPESNGMVVGSLLKTEAQAPGATSTGYVVTIPGFGRVYIGEMIITPKSRRLSMLRFEMRCPTEGDVITGGPVEGNGSRYP